MSPENKALIDRICPDNFRVDNDYDRLTGDLSALLDAARQQGRDDPVTDAQGVAWFEARFGVPIGDKPGADDVARLNMPQKEAWSRGE